MPVLLFFINSGLLLKKVYNVPVKIAGLVTLPGGGSAVEW